MDETTRYQDLKPNKDFIDLTGFKIPRIGGNVGIECDEEGNFYIDKSDLDIKITTYPGIMRTARMRIKKEFDENDFWYPITLSQAMGMDYSEEQLETLVREGKIFKGTVHYPDLIERKKKTATVYSLTKDVEMPPGSHCAVTFEEDYRSWVDEDGLLF